jgi:sec-independent protein translocase protein TatB
MFDIGWSELLVIAVIAIVVVGPRDLPRMMRTVGQLASQGRRMMRELQGQFNQAIREADLEDTGQQLTNLTGASPGNTIRKAMAPLTSALDDVKKSVDEAGRTIERDAAAAAAGGEPAKVEPALGEPGPGEPAPGEPAAFPSARNGAVAAEAPPDASPDTAPAAPAPASAPASAKDDPKPQAQRAAAGS